MGNDNDNLNNDIGIDCEENYNGIVNGLVLKYNKLVSKELRVVKEYVHRMEIQIILKQKPILFIINIKLMIK